MTARKKTGSNEAFGPEQRKTTTRARRPQPPPEEAPPPTARIDEDLEFYRRLFLDSNDAHFVLDGRSGTFRIVNARFCEITGYSQAELTDGQFRPASLVYGRGRERAEEQIKSLPEDGAGLFEWIGSDRNGRVWDVEASLRRIRHAGRPYVLGEIRDVGARKDLERRLLEEVDKQRKKTIRAAKAGVRVYQLTEKIKRLPTLLGRLDSVVDEDAFFECLREGLLGSEGLGYAGAAVYLVDGKQLHCTFSTKDMPIKRFHMDKNHKLARIARHGERFYDGALGELVVPLRRSGHVVGLFQVHFDEGDRLLFEENETIERGQENLVEVLAVGIQAIWERVRHEKRLKEQSRADALTGLANRPAFEVRLVEETKRAQRYQRELSFLLVGVDRFREINEVWGRAVGDRVLTALADFLRQQFREMDILARFDADEFAILLPETGLEEARPKAEDVRYKLERTPFPFGDRAEDRIEVTISIGVSSRTAGVTDPAEMTRNAAEALQAAKREGRNVVCFFEDRPRVLPRRLSTALE